MFLLVRRKAVEKVGMMDESFFLYYEETDWCRRFVNEGWNILFWPGAKVLHLDGGGKSSPGKDSEMFARQRKSMLLYFKKHHGWSACLMARLILSVSYGMRFCIWNMILLLKHFAGASTAKAKEECRKCWGVVKICIAEKA
jgi:GT2 family glycosyltransferase